MKKKEQKNKTDRQTTKSPIGCCLGSRLCKNLLYSIVAEQKEKHAYRERMTQLIM